MASRGCPCRVHSENVKVRPADDLFYYPDVMVVCHDEEGDPLFETNPCLLIEALSPDTETVDGREKLMAYKGISSLKAYLLVHQDTARVERYWINREGRWLYAQVSGTGRVPIPCPEVTLTLEAIHEGLPF